MRRAEGTWRTFQLVHLLDPNEPEHKDYEKWSGAKWRKWLKTRDEKNLQLSGSQKRQFDSKGKQVNSVIIASPDEILKTFKESSKRYDFFGRKYWSDSAFPMYLFDLSGNSNQVRCSEPVYFVASLDESKRPIRFKMYNKEQNTNSRNECVSIAVPESNSKIESIKKLTAKLSS